MKKILSLIIITVMALSLAGCGEKSEPEVHKVNLVIGDKAGAESQASDNAESDVELLTGKYAVRIEIENYGDIIVELDADLAPISVTNFMKLVNEDFYKGLTFHRIIEGFMMQGGESHEKKAATIKGEFALNGIDNPIKHERGAISMARTNDPNSADSQFFICHQDSEFLDGQYAAFGHVIGGMDVVDKVCETAVVIDNNGTVPPEYQPVIKGIYDVTEEYKNGAFK